MFNREIFLFTFIFKSGTGQLHAEVFIVNIKIYILYVKDALAVMDIKKFPKPYFICLNPFFFNLRIPPPIAVYLQNHLSCPSSFQTQLPAKAIEFFGTDGLI